MAENTLKDGSVSRRELASQIFSRFPLPRPGAVADLVHWPAQEEGTPEYWTIRVYADNLRLLAGEDQKAIGRWMFVVIDAMEREGLTVYPEKHERVPR